jgi:hypothetical protein
MIVKVARKNGINLMTAKTQRDARSPRSEASLGRSLVETPFAVLAALRFVLSERGVAVGREALAIKSR